ncbi:MAG: VacJ family lipoprotein [Pseudomonadota bacterium]|nr:VacJ family lipoprotein [Pseudomonadota bacterium]
MSLLGKIKSFANGALALALCLTLLAAGCATPPPASDRVEVEAFEKVNDPYEPFNRSMLDFNLAVDKVVLRPITSLYRATVPDSLQDNFHNFLENLRSPVILVNDILQGEFQRAGTTLVRFAINSTIGLLGFNDFATENGVEKHAEDFGQTLASWDVESGPYLVLPIFGPSNPRDGIGLLGDILMDPFTWLAPLEVRIGRAALTTVDKRSQKYNQINDLRKNSLDLYSAIRSLYRQRRSDEIRNGVPTANDPVPGGLSDLPSKVIQSRQNNASLAEK